jgi:hypothetical protein
VGVWTGGVGVGMVVDWTFVCGSVERWFTGNGFVEVRGATRSFVLGGGSVFSTLGKAW